MDKYIDNFCEKYFSEFEELGLKTDTDVFFEHPPKSPFMMWLLPIVGALLVAIIVNFVFKHNEHITGGCYDVAIGLVSSICVAWFFELRDKRRAYYAEVVSIINVRMFMIEKALKAANEHKMNISADEGLHLLQKTAQNAYEFAGYLDDKLNHIVDFDMTKGLQYEATIGNPANDDERELLCGNARWVVAKILYRLRCTIRLIRQKVYGETSWETYSITDEKDCVK